jgi:hypothetical protein
MVVAIIPRVSKPKALYEGLCLDDFVKCRIPCSWDDKRRTWIGPKEKRVEINASLSCPATKTTNRYFVIGTGLILRHLPGVIWIIEEVEHNAGVFINALTLDFLISKHGVQVPPTGDLRKYLDEF